MRNFVDRKEEWAVLESEYKTKGASFVVVYGRRRVGKSTLLSKFCEGKKHIYFLATEENERQNREEFQRMIAETCALPMMKEAKFDRWEPLFEQLSVWNSESEKYILVIDEFQYLGKANSAFPSVLMKIWDTFLKDTNIMLILCGSLIRMMTDQVLNYNSPLYGRRTSQIRMRQIPYQYYAEFMPQIDEKKRELFYAVTGGVPKYIEQIEPEKDFFDAVESSVLNQNSFLYVEPEFLLEKEVSEIGSYFSILRVIALGATKMSEISSRLEIKQSGLSKYLKTLTELDIIERQVPVTEENPEKSKMGQYRIKDNFIRFWFLFVYTNRGFLEAGRKDYVKKRIEEHFIDGHMSYVYEEICREKMWGMPDRFPVFDRLGRWWNRNAEIDIVAYNSDGNDIIFGECKYSVRPKGMEVLRELREKSIEVDWNRGRRAETYVLFSRSGYTSDLHVYAQKHPEIILL